MYLDVCALHITYWLSMLAKCQIVWYYSNFPLLHPWNVAFYLIGKWCQLLCPGKYRLLSYRVSYTSLLYSPHNTQRPISFSGPHISWLHISLPPFTPCHSRFTHSSNFFLEEGWGLQPSLVSNSLVCSQGWPWAPPTSTSQVLGL